jgi:luciferase family oxidoreductase group 1
MKMKEVSILEQSVSVEGKPQSVTIQDSINLAKTAEKLGYKRFWVSEHHNHPTIVGTAPEVLMAAIATQTKNIRIGSAGIMLPHYSPFKVAEQFRVLEALAPNRIDLGLGRAPGSDGRTALALNPNSRNDSEQFPGHVRDLMAWVNNEKLIEGHPFGSLIAQPTSETGPEMWILGTSNYGAQLAAYLGIPYCFAHFITNGSGMKSAIEIYKSEFQPNKKYKKPRVNVCLWALTAKTNDEAKYLFSSRAAWKIGRDIGHLGPITDPDNALNIINSNNWENEYNHMYENSLVGEINYTKDKIDKLIKENDVDEISILSWCHDENARIKSYELFSNAYELNIKNTNYKNVSVN